MTFFHTSSSQASLAQEAFVKPFHVYRHLYTMNVLPLLVFAFSFFLITSLCAGDHASPPGPNRSSVSTSDIVQYPSWVPLRNVRDYGAVGDGQTDDTAAIQRAIQDRKFTVQLYFPPGTYLVSDTLVGLGRTGEPQCWMQFYGSGRSVTRIKLKDQSPGFQDTANPRPVIWFRGKITAESGQPREQPNVAFFNSAYDLTIDVGSGNPAAVGIDWMVCNTGSLRRVDIISTDPKGQGFAGLRMSRNDGTSFMRDVRITGFDYGWWRAANAQSMAVESLTLKNQLVAGIYNRNSVFTIRGLSSENRVPTLLQVEATCQATLLNAQITGGAPAAIVQESPDAFLYLRDVEADGSHLLVQNPPEAPSSSLPGPRLSGEWFSHPPVVVNQTTPSASLNLPIKDAPDFHDNDPANWATPADFSDDSTGDYSVRLQKAIDSGATTIVLDSSGRGHFRSPVVVRGRVRRIIGFWKQPTAAKDSDIQNPYDESGRLVPSRCFLRIADGDGSPLIIEQFHQFAGAIYNESSRALVLRDMGADYENGPTGTGDLFVEGNMCAHYRIGHGQNAWLRSVDAVFGKYNPDILADGSNVVVLSNRTEGGGVFVEAINGAKVEILGTSHFIANVHKTYGPGEATAYTVRNASLSIVNYSETGFGKNYPATLISATQGGVDTQIDRDYTGVYPRHRYRRFLLFRSDAAR
ncbi:hypothetical protein DB346_00990 [Verrucomicrobia bacterium LW23]|nr:hypothetical protein DB346_00990 [Verrucomicrobia bacterium LW23]